MAHVDNAAIDARVEAARHATGTPGAAVAVVVGDEVVHLKGYGVKAFGGDEAVTPDTLFAIGSTTKAFTTAAIALLVDEGKMAWDDPVRKHVPFFRLSDPLADANVTLRDLVCHRTGLSRHDALWYGSPWGREEVIRRIGLVKPNTSFRSAYEYQNIMFLTAGQAVGTAAGTTWEEFTRARLFAPLGITGASFSAADAERSPERATPHEKKDDRIKLIPWRNIDNVGPAGSINAGVRDLSRWVRFQLAGGEFEGKRVISEANLKETHTPQVPIRLDDATRGLYPDMMQMSYGLGWVVFDYFGHPMVTHGGGIDGFITEVALLPREKIGVVVLSNMAPNWLPQAVRNQIVDLILGLSGQDWNAKLAERLQQGQDKQKEQEREREEKRHKDTQPSRDLTAYTGTYEEPAYGTAHVALENGALTLQWSNWTVPLTHYHHDTWTAGGEDTPLEKEQATFVLGADGEVASLKFLKVEFQKAKAT